MQEPDIAASDPQKKLRLRLMATSDLHMQIMAFDYVTDCATRGGSLARLATLIKAARAEADACGMASLLLDNGDTLQGTPLADLMAKHPGREPHPMIACMSTLRYDAGGLGNHDFDHGLDMLASQLQQHQMPVICSNMRSTTLPMVRKSLIMDAAKAGGDVLRVGILSTLPDKTALWSRHHVEGRVEFLPPLAALRHEAAELRKEGADIIVVLAHMGLALFEEGDDAQNLISEVAAIGDVDVVIGGHTHMRFPGPEHESVVEADCTKGRVHGKPVLQPGASGADLGVMDLTLERISAQGRWYVGHADVGLRPATRHTPEDAEILAIARPMHLETRRYLSKPVAHLARPVNSFFALAAASPVPALLAAAQSALIARMVAGTTLADLPLVSVASTPLTGGYDGPDNFLNLQAGQINRQHVAGMNPYANHVWAVRTTGAQLRDWLERSAQIFNTLSPDRPDGMLVDPHIPGFRYDSIYGLSYQVDPRHPPRFDPAGRRVPQRASRIRNLCWQGRPLDDTQEFLAATSDHRAGGGGLYQTFSTSNIAVQGHAPLQDAALDYLTSDRGSVFPAAPWSFVPNLGCTAILLTAPEAVNHLDQIAALRPEPAGETPEGFLRLRLHL